MKKYAIFGAGEYGKYAVEELGAERVSYIIDNNQEIQHTKRFGIEVIGLEELIEKGITDMRIVIATIYCETIMKQLDAAGITEYEIFFSRKARPYYSSDIFLLNPYEENVETRTEEEYIAKTQENSARIKYLNECAKLLAKEKPLHLFDRMEIETYNRCNGICDFCPVSKGHDPRPEMKMPKELFEKIIGDLRQLNYSGKLALFSNNEPFLDDRICDFLHIARIRVPQAKIHLYTNGTELTLSKFMEAMKYLDELIIDNYNQQLSLIPKVREIKQYCEEHPEIKKKVTIVLRKPHEVLSSRGGDAPNRTSKVSYGDDKCLLPFRQMIVRPDGKVSLCCNDPLGRNTMGDLNTQTLSEIWYGEMFEEARTAILQGRKNWSHCRYCDTFQLG